MLDEINLIKGCVTVLITVAAESKKKKDLRTKLNRIVSFLLGSS